jgi:protein O-mannosyl-transferase
VLDDHHRSKSGFTLLLAVLLLTVVLYLPVFSYEFVFDDHNQIVANERIQSWSYLPGYFSEHVWAQLYGHGQANYYRPLFVTWLLINYSAFASDPLGWHGTTLLVHLVVVILVFCLARRLLQDDAAASLATLIFAIHPLQIESIAWIAGVTEPLVAIFVFGGLLTYFKSQEGRNARFWFAASVLCYFLGLLCKESAVLLPVAVFLYALFFDSKQENTRIQSLRRATLQALSYAPALVVYFAMRIHALQKPFKATPKATWDTLLLTIPSLIWFYMRELVAPYRLALFYDVAYVEDAPGFLLPLIAITVIGALLLFWARHSRLIRFCSLWMGLFLLLPLSGARLFGHNNGLVHDRYLYISLFGFAVLAAKAWTHLPRSHSLFGRNAWQTVALIAIVVAFSWGTVSQEKYWRNDVTLFQRSFDINPDTTQPIKAMLAGALLGRGQSSESFRLFNEAYRENPDWFTTFGLARWYFQEQQYAQAEEYFLRCIALNTTSANQYYLLGMSRLKLGRHEEALDPLAKAASMVPKNVDFRMDLASALQQAGRYQDSLTAYKLIAQERPEESHLRRYIAVLEAKQAKADQDATSH